MKTYEEFKKELTENMKERLGGAVEITIHTVVKNNTKEEQIIIRLPEEKLSPSVSLKKLFEEYQTEENLGHVAERLEQYLKHIPVDFEMPMLTEAQARENIFYQLVSAEKNEDLLHEFRMFHETDLALVLRWKCGEGASFLVKHGLAEQIGVSEEQLFEMADANLAQQQFRFRPMHEVLAEMMGIDPDLMPASDLNLYVLTNEDGNCGAAVFTRQGVRQRIFEKLNGPYFILPSSTHELLIIPDDGNVNADELAAMVKEINLTEVAPQDVLSDHVYRFELRQHVKMVV